MSESDDSEPDHNESKDIEKLHQIWKGLKDSKRGDRFSDKKSLLSVKEAIHQEEQKNLEVRLAMTEKQLGKARENTALLMKKLSEAEEEIDVLRQQLQFEKRNSRRVHQAPPPPSNDKHNTFAGDRDNQQLVGEMEELRQLIDQKNRDIQRLNLKIRGLELDQQKTTDQLDKLAEDNDELKRQLQQAQRTMHEIYLDQESKGAQLLEIDELNRTIERLIGLLKSTHEYKQFALFTEDAKAVHFLKHIPKRLKANSLLQPRPNKPKMCTCMDIHIEEKLIWTPTQSYKFMLDMKLKYETLNEECIEEVLFGLNQIWLARQENHVKRVRENYEAELQKLRKKMEQRYDEMLARKQIQRLKKEVSKARYKGDKNTVKIDSLKVAGQYEDELRLKEKEIRLLHERVKLIESESTNYDKVIYMEGALWILAKVVDEVEATRDSLRDFEDHFSQTLGGLLNGQENPRLMKTYKLFFDSLQELHDGLYEKLLVMQESTTKKLMEKRQLDQKENVKGSNRP